MKKKNLKQGKKMNKMSGTLFNENYPLDENGVIVFAFETI